MNPLRIFRHADCEGAGYLAGLVERHNIPCEIVASNQDDAIPTSINDVSGLVFLGGRMGVGDSFPWLRDEISLIKKANRAGVPVLGHGLGAELIALALEASVVRHPVKEIGWFPVMRQDNETAREWFAGVPEIFDIFLWHEQAFSLPEGATPLLKSEWHPTEAFLHGNILALQGHLEMTMAMVREWTTVYADQLARPAQVSNADELAVNWDAVVQGADKICLNLERKVAALHAVADVVYGRWLRLL